MHSYAITVHPMLIRLEEELDVVDRNHLTVVADRGQANNEQRSVDELISPCLENNVVSEQLVSSVLSSNSGG